MIINYDQTQPPSSCEEALKRQVEKVSDNSIRVESILFSESFRSNGWRKQLFSKAITNERYVKDAN